MSAHQNRFVMRKLIAIILIGVMGVLPLYSEAQSSDSDPWSLWMDPQTDDFATIQQQVEAYYVNRDKGRGSGYKHWKRWERENLARLDSEGRIQHWTKRAFDEYHRYEHSIADNADRSTTGSWAQVGPTDYIRTGNGYNGGIGRVNCVAFHPTNANTIFAGLPAGGLWKSTNLGASWTPLTDGLPSIGVSSIAIHPTDPDIIYILTGDGDGGHTWTVGVLKTTNGGDTWLSTGLTWDVSDNAKGYKLVMDPTDPNVLLAATTEGVYRTTNAGSSWTETFGSWTFDIEFKPGDHNIMYLHTSNLFYKSVNNGLTWSVRNAGLPSGETRAAIAVSAANPNYVYVLAGPPDSAGVFKGIFRSLDSGENFAPKANTPNILGYASDGSDASHQTWYDHALAADPTNEANIFTGGINVWKSTNWGNTMTNVTQWNEIGAANYTHADIHNIEFNPLDGSLYVCSDGGIYRSTNGGSSFTKFSSGMCTMAFYDIADYEGDANHIIGGTQDNGTNYKNYATAIWNHIDGGDGSDVLIDHTYPNTLYLNVNEVMVKSINYGASTVIIGPSNNGWAELEMDAGNSNRIYAGYNHGVYRSINGGLSWTLISPADSSVVPNRQMKLGVNNTSRMYVTNGSTLWRSDDVQAASPTWNPKSAGISGGTIQDIAVDPDWSLNVAVCLGGYNDGYKVYISDNGGDSWTNISGSLPNIPFNCITWADGSNGALYLGGDVGVYYRHSGMTDWLPFRTGLPHVPIKDLEIHEATGLIRAGTFGRGLWQTSTYTPCPSNYVLSDGSLPLSASTGYRYFQSSGYIRSTRTIDGGIGTNEIYQAADYVQLNNGFEVAPGTEFHAYNAPCVVLPEEYSMQVELTGTYAGPMPGVIEEVVGVADADAADHFLVYPNPSTGPLNIEFSIEGEQAVSLILTDLAGRIVAEPIVQKHMYQGTYKIGHDVSDLSAGMYICAMKKNDHTYTKRISVISAQ